jgi:hypothetical protein
MEAYYSISDCLVSGTIWNNYLVSGTHFNFVGDEPRARQSPTRGLLNPDVSLSSKCGTTPAYRADQ